jgi:sulfur-oxidizing protein SoxY
VVPVTVETDFPARNIAVLVEKNPQPLAASFEFGEGGGNYVSVRLKMGESSTVLALAQTADGKKVLGASKLVKVTIGGCGG